MIDGKTKPLHIAAIGLNERMLKTLEIFFRETCKQKFVLVEEKLAEVMLIDIDAFQARRIWDQYHKRYPNRPVITLSLNEVESDHGIFVRKPIRSEHFLAVLTRISEQIQQQTLQQAMPKAARPTVSVPKGTSTVTESSVGVDKGNRSARRKNVIAAGEANAVAGQLNDKDIIDFIGTMADIDSRDEKQAIKAQYDPNGYLQGHIARAAALAVEKQQVVRLETGWHPITIFPRSGMAKVEITDAQLRFVSVIPITAEETRLILLGEDKIDPYQLEEVQSVETLLWKVALRTSRGRVPSGTDFERPIHLRHWPNMTRMLITPHTLRIAALWMKAPNSLIKTAQIMKIPQRYVFAFYSAVHAIGLVGPAQQADITPIGSVQSNQPGNRGVFTRILNRLSR